MLDPSFNQVVAEWRNGRTSTTWSLLFATHAGLIAVAVGFLNGSLESAYWLAALDAVLLLMAVFDAWALLTHVKAD